MWFCPRPGTYCEKPFGVFLVVDIWGLSGYPQDFCLEHQLKSRLAPPRLGGKERVFIFLTGFIEVEGWFPPIRCPIQIFPWRNIDFAHLSETEENPWFRLPSPAPRGTRFDYQFFFLGVVLWARIDNWPSVLERSDE